MSFFYKKYEAVEDRIVDEVSDRMNTFLEASGPPSNIKELKHVTLIALNIAKRKLVKYIPGAEAGRSNVIQASARICLAEAKVGFPGDYYMLGVMMDSKKGKFMLELSRGDEESENDNYDEGKYPSR